MGHCDVVLHHQHYLRRGLRFQLQSATNALGDLDAARYVPTALAFADVVQKEREIKQCDVFDFVKDSAQMRTTTVLAVIQFVERLDNFERVLIDCVMVVKIMLDQQADPSELRQIAPQESNLMHHAQNMR